MSSVKGPRSALTDFIEEHGIKIDNSSRNVTENKTEVVERKRKVVQKKYKKSKPYEFSSKDLHSKSLTNILLLRIIGNIEKYSLNDSHLEMVSSFLSNQRKFNLEYFNLIVNSSKDKLVLYDCSMIKDEEYKVNNFNLTTLELHQCGQLTNYKLKEILMSQKKLEVLRITGGYLLTEICLPRKLKILDLSNCNRVNNSIILEINKKYKKLDELRLSYCYKITDEIKLKTRVARLFLEETQVSEDFFISKGLTEIFFKNCLNINNLIKFYENIEYLDLENITTIKNINIGNKLKHLNIQRCYNLIQWLDINKKKLVNLEYLNISYLEIESFEFIFDLKSLKDLDLSWCSNVTDDLLIRLTKNTKIQNINVFGCFNLSSKSAKISYENKERITIIGNHAETKYLIHNH